MVDAAGLRYHPFSQGSGPTINLAGVVYGSQFTLAHAKFPLVGISVVRNLDAYDEIECLPSANATQAVERTVVKLCGGEQCAARLAEACQAVPVYDNQACDGRPGVWCHNLCVRDSAPRLRYYSVYSGTQETIIQTEKPVEGIVIGTCLDKLPFGFRVNGHSIRDIEKEEWKRCLARKSPGMSWHFAHHLLNIRRDEVSFYDDGLVPAYSQNPDKVRSKVCSNAMVNINLTGTTDTWPRFDCGEWPLGSNTPLDRSRITNHVLVDLETKTAWCGTVISNMSNRTIIDGNEVCIKSNYHISAGPYSSMINMWGRNTALGCHESMPSVGLLPPGSLTIKLSVPWFTRAYHFFTSPLETIKEEAEEVVGEAFQWVVSKWDYFVSTMEHRLSILLTGMFLCALVYVQPQVAMQTWFAMLVAAYAFNIYAGGFYAEACDVQYGIVSIGSDSVESYASSMLWLLVWTTAKGVLDSHYQTLFGCAVGLFFAKLFCPSYNYDHGFYRSFVYCPLFMWALHDVPEVFRMKLAIGFVIERLICPCSFVDKFWKSVDEAKLYSGTLTGPSIRRHGAGILNSIPRRWGVLVSWWPGGKSEPPSKRGVRLGNQTPRRVVDRVRKCYFHPGEWRGVAATMHDLSDMELLNFMRYAPPKTVRAVGDMAWFPEVVKQARGKPP